MAIGGQSVGADSVEYDNHYIRWTFFLEGAFLRGASESIPNEQRDYDSLTFVLIVYRD